MFYGVCLYIDDRPIYLNVWGLFSHHIFNVQRTGVTLDHWSSWMRPYSGLTCIRIHRPKAEKTPVLRKGPVNSHIKVVYVPRKKIGFVNISRRIIGEPWESIFVVNVSGKTPRREIDLSHYSGHWRFHWKSITKTHYDHCSHPQCHRQYVHREQLPSFFTMSTVALCQRKSFGFPLIN